VEKVIPAMQDAQNVEIVAIASRDRARAEATAGRLGIPRAYGSYEALLADPAVEAIYNPLPNHLHVPLTEQAADAGKHVLVEKPVALDAAEAARLLSARDRNGVMIQEAFMVRSHPQWLRTRELVRIGRIGELRAINAVFSYFNADPANVRNQADIGGGALYDIGCYPINVSRLVFESEPQRVAALVERDPQFGTDRLTSALMQFDRGHLAFTVSTQLVPYQRVHVLGTKGRIEIRIPVNAPDEPDEPTTILLDDGSALGDASAVAETFPACDQYRLQGEQFSAALRGEGEQVLALEDSIANMRVIDAVFRAGAEGAWAVP
jgi:predicted dehydrogenase